jgi:hypothetical protein
MCVAMYTYMHKLCVHICVCPQVPGRCGSAWRDQQDLMNWVTHTTLSGLEAEDQGGMGEPCEFLGLGSGPGSGSRSDGDPAPHTAS